MSIEEYRRGARFSGVIGRTVDESKPAWPQMLEHRSIYHDGWRAVCPWPGDSFAEGRPFGTPISDAYRPPFAFTGTLYRVIVEVGREGLIEDSEAQMRAVMAHQ